jgi:glycerol-3-phosphate responsive antiterminator
VKAQSGQTITTKIERFKPAHIEDNAIVIIAVDNMTTRKEVVDSANKAAFIIDGRMTGLAFHIVTLYPAEASVYLEQDWFPDG